MANRNGPGDKEDGGTTHEGQDGSIHATHHWNDGDGLAHRESWNVDSDGNESNDHYTQTDHNGSQVQYNYDTGEWSEK